MEKNTGVRRFEWGVAARRWAVGLWRPLAIGVVGLFLAYSVANTMFFSHGRGVAKSIRYRETIHYEIGGVPRTASGVREVSLSVNDGAIGAGPGVFLRGLRGEAIVLDEGAKGLVLALKKFPYDQAQRAITLIEAACGPDRMSIAYGNGYSDRLEQWLGDIAGFKGPCAVPVPDWPLLVRFSDPVHPQTVERLATEDLVGGDPNVPRITSVILEPTTDPISANLVERLPWINNPTSIPWNALEIDGPGLDGAAILRLAPSDLTSELTN